MLPLLQRLKTWAASLQRDTVALWIAARDPRTPWLAKLIAGAVAAYALSPLDLIPDFIPILGYLDDLLIVPLGLALAIRLVPPLLMETFRAQAVAQLARPKSLGAAAIILTLWLIGAGVMALWAWTRL